MRPVIRRHNVIYFAECIHLALWRFLKKSSIRQSHDHLLESNSTADDRLEELKLPIQDLR